MFKSKKEMAQAMLDGKVVEFEDGAIAFFDGAVGSSPFRYKKQDVGSAFNLASAWDLHKAANIKKEWHDKVSKEKPRLCWVSDSQADKKEFVGAMIAYKRGWYRSTTGTKWKYATPVKREELEE